ncbi:hypothetical protein D3C85_1187070 [compost metagenome]
MTESQPQNSESNNENGLTPGSMEEAFALDGARRNLDGVWNPEDPEWKEAYEVQRMMIEAGLTEPAVNLDKLREAVSDLAEARQAIDEVFDGKDDESESN